MGESVLAQLAGLKAMKTPELKAMWRDLFDTEPPAYNRRFLVSRLAYRIQELAAGGVDAKLEARLDAIAGDGAYVDPANAAKKIIDRSIAGTRLIREWQGVEHQVTVMNDGFEYQGRPYKSLSAIARAITGTRWNGPLFFGLRKNGSRK